MRKEFFDLQLKRKDCPVYLEEIRCLFHLSLERPRFAGPGLTPYKIRGLQSAKKRGVPRQARPCRKEKKEQDKAAKDSLILCDTTRKDSQIGNGVDSFKISLFRNL